MRGLHCESCNYNAEPQAERNRFYEKGTIFGLRCPCGDDCGSDCRAQRRGSLVGDGAVPSEDSSGKRIQRGPITKTGNTHLRRIAIEAAWAYRHRPAIGLALRKRQEGLSEEVKEPQLFAFTFTSAPLVKQRVDSSPVRY